MLRIKVEYAAGNACVHCEGALLWGGGLENFHDLAGKITAESIVIDLSEVRRVDAHGVGALVCVVQDLRRRGMPAFIANAQPQVRQVLETCGLAALLSARSRYCSPAA